jgi:LCP family protein required for cell wall assembly
VTEPPLDPPAGDPAEPSTAEPAGPERFPEAKPAPAPQAPLPGSAAKPRRSRRRRAVRVLSWVAVLTSISVLAASVLGFGALALINSHVDRKCIFCGESPEVKAHRPQKPQGESGKALNFLLVGSDSRDGATPEELKEFSTEADPGKRTDTIILVHLSPKRDKAVLVSFPRDTWVDIPGHGHNRINAAYVNGELDRKGGGPALLIQTVEQLTNVFIDHYLEVDFRGFLKMVNALGGVDVCLPTAVDDKLSGLNLPAGRSHVKGKAALSFVRARHFDPTQDLGRIRRQQQFLGAMLRRATSLGILARPDKLYRFLDTVAKSLTVDDKLSFNDMKALAGKLRGLDPAKIVFVTAPVGRSTTIERKSVVLPDEAGYAALFGAIRADDAIQAGATPAPAQPPSDLIVRPSRIRLRVLNGNGTDGAAGKAATDLGGVGFQIVGTGSADAFTYTQTIVRYGPSKADSARTVAAAIPGSALQPDQTLGSVIEVVVGQNYTGTRPVTVASPSTGPTPLPTSSPSPIRTTTAADEPEGC